MVIRKKPLAFVVTLWIIVLGLYVYSNRASATYMHVDEPARCGTINGSFAKVEPIRSCDFGSPGGSTNDHGDSWSWGCYDEWGTRSETCRVNKIVEAESNVVRQTVVPVVPIAVETHDFFTHYPIVEEPKKKKKKKKKNSRNKKEVYEHECRMDRKHMPKFIKKMSDREIKRYCRDLLNKC